MEQDIHKHVLNVNFFQNVFSTTNLSSDTNANYTLLKSHVHV
jgi:hypothetical protein